MNIEKRKTVMADAERETMTKQGIIQQAVLLASNHDAHCDHASSTLDYRLIHDKAPRPVLSTPRSPSPFSVTRLRQEDLSSN